MSPRTTDWLNLMLCEKQTLWNSTFIWGLNRVIRKHRGPTSEGKNHYFLIVLTIRTIKRKTRLGWCIYNKKWWFTTHKRSQPNYNETRKEVRSPATAVGDWPASRVPRAYIIRQLRAPGAFSWNKHCQRHHGPKALSALTPSTIFI